MNRVRRGERVRGPSPLIDLVFKGADFSHGGGASAAAPPWAALLTRGAANLPATPANGS